MMKMKKRILSLLMVVATAAVMFLGKGITAMAAVSDTTATPVTTATIDLNKYFYLDGTGNLPTKDSFTWELERISFSPASDQITDEAVTDVPAPNLTDGTNGTATVAADGTNKWTATVVVTPDAAAAGAARSKSGSGTVVIPIQNNLNEANATRPGVYTYTVTEKKDSTADGVTYDEDTYFINVYVKNVLNDDGTPSGLTTIANITAWKGTANMPGGDITGNESDVTDTTRPEGWNPNGDNTSEEATADGNDAAAGKTSITSTPDNAVPTNMTIKYPFTNIYETKDLSVSKKVTGNYASKEDKFTYTVNVADGAWTPGVEGGVADHEFEIK
ncbi:MAG: hypothetical protein EOM18_13740, partial [Clostridia bacterium]|nr:hypothetical protein [Clostridia bacterium]